MAIKNHKKAMFFSLLAIILVMLFIIVFKGANVYMTHYNEEASIQKTRFVNYFVDDLKNTFLPRILDISSKNAIQSMLDSINNTGNYINNAYVEYNMLMWNGTYVNGSIAPLMGNISLYNWTNRIKRIALDNLGIETNITYSTLNISHNTPWEVTVKYNVSLSIKKENILYTINDEVAQNISIEGYIEPMSILYQKTSTGTGNALRYIQRTNRTFNPAERNASTTILMETGYFRSANNNSPDFLMRLEGLTTGSLGGYGIHALINKSFFDADLGGDANRSSIDYRYYNSTISLGQDCPPNAKLIKWDEYDDASHPEMEYFKVSELEWDFYNTTGVWDDICS